MVGLLCSFLLLRTSRAVVCDLVFLEQRIPG